MGAPLAGGRCGGLSSVDLRGSAVSSGVLTGSAQQRWWVNPPEALDNQELVVGAPQRGAIELRCVAEGRGEVSCVALRWASAHQ